MSYDPLVQQQAGALFRTWSSQAAALAGEGGFSITQARGARFRAGDGRWYWDLESQVYNVNAGHGHPHIRAAMKRQIDDVAACGPNVALPIRRQLAEALCSASGMQRVFLTTGGSEANENAIKIARLVTGRRKVIVRRHSYHGATLEILGISGDARRNPFFPTALGAELRIEDPHASAGPGTWLDHFDEILAREGSDTIAAVLLEGLTGTNGMQSPPADFWPGVRARCSRHGIVLIDDEVFSGFGRTGRYFACEHYGVQPDIITIGKGLTSGYAPLAGLLVRGELAAQFDHRPLICGLTHYAHPVSCAAALASMEVIESEGLVANAAEVGLVLQQTFEGWRSDASLGGLMRGHRGKGLMLGLELARNAAPLVDRLWARGVFAPFREHMLWICPPLCFSESDAQTVSAILHEELAAWAGETEGTDADESR